MNPLFIAALLLLGACTGFAAGLLGIGGGMLLVPFLTALFTWQGYPAEQIVHMAIATSLATILFTSLSSVRAHDRHGAVLWHVVWLLAPGILLGSLIGAQIAGLLPTFWLSVIFAVFVGFSAMQMLRDRKPRATRELPRGIGMFSAGGAIGFISSLVGAGGAFMSVPFMIWHNVPIHSVVGTSAALGFPIAAAGTLGYIIAGYNDPGLPPGTLGFVFLPALFAIALASVITAPMGARLAHKLDRRRMQRVFTGLLFVLAGYMAYKGYKAY